MTESIKSEVQKIPQTTVVLETNLEQLQEIIYHFLLDQVKLYSPQQVLKEFHYLFFLYLPTQENQAARKALFEITFANQKKYFFNTLKRCCYILINNWQTNPNNIYIQDLLDKFTELKPDELSVSPVNKKLNLWLTEFRDSQDYQNLKLFINKNSAPLKKHWSENYISYLLVPDYLNKNNPQEQREAAKALSEQLKLKFRFELAIYTAHSPRELNYAHQRYHNPTDLGDGVLRLIKILLVKQGLFNYRNFAHLFLEQTQGKSYLYFKNALYKYLTFSLTNQNFIDCLAQKFLHQLSSIYQEFDQRICNEILIYKTCNRIFDYLLTENKQEPSDIFINCLVLNNPIIFVIILLKLVLICPHSRNYLENNLAILIKYYLDYNQEDCQWFVNFLEIFNVTFAIYADQNIEYNLIKISEQNFPSDTYLDLDSYRIFSQQKSHLQK